MVVEETARGERAYDIYSWLLKGHILFIGTSTLFMVLEIGQGLVDASAQIIGRDLYAAKENATIHPLFEGMELGCLGSVQASEGKEVHILGNCGPPSNIRLTVKTGRDAKGWRRSDGERDD